MNPNFYTIAYFVSSHGFGHAARASAIMDALHTLSPRLHFEIFTKVPAWFFETSLSPSTFTHHDHLTDIGLVQETALNEDLTATLQRLSDFYPLSPAQTAPILAELQRLRPCLILCDIAPLGIYLAEQLAIPSVLIENFTWDWIYTGYLQEAPAFASFIPYLHDLFQRATYHIQTTPFCSPHPNAILTTNPVSRRPHSDRHSIRQQLCVPSNNALALISMGGYLGHYPFIEALKAYPGITFVLPGTSAVLTFDQNIVRLPHHSAFYHPDLVNAADVIVSKAGYSTISEAFHAGIPFIYASRTRFREAGPMQAFIEAHLQGVGIEEAEFPLGNWLPLLPNALSHPRSPNQLPNGADQAANFILSLLQ